MLLIMYFIISEVVAILTLIWPRCALRLGVQLTLSLRNGEGYASVYLLNVRHPIPAQ